jgi:hypothetical protein
MARDTVTFDDLVRIAQRVGVEVVAAPSSHRGALGKMGTKLGPTIHHTGTANTFRPTEDYPDYNVVKEGRTGLVNSLSAYGLGRFRAIYVFSEFLSWHAGEWNYRGVTDGNGHFLGIECAGVGDWTPWQRKVLPRLVASILLFLGGTVDWMPRHLDGAMPRGRKTDAANLWASFRDEVQFFMDHPEQININYVAGAAKEEDDVAKFKAFRSDPNQGTGADQGNGSIALAAPGFWYSVPSPGYWQLLLARGITEDCVNVPHNEYLYFQSLYLLPEANDAELVERTKAIEANVAAFATKS